MNAVGIDISYANYVTPNLAGRAFCFVRACYGTSRDHLWDYHVANVRRAGVILGGYAFGVYGDGAGQARAFLDIAASADLLALDLEAEAGKTPMTEAQARDFLATVKAAGRTVGLYHSESGFPTLGQDWNWVARWGEAPPERSWTIWQYRGDPLDLDMFNGDLAALHRFAGMGGEMINANGMSLSSRKVARMTEDTVLLKSPGGARVAPVPAGRRYPLIGVADGHRAVLVSTKLVYPDGVTRPTVLFVPAAAVAIEDAPPPATVGDVKHRVAITVDGTTQPDTITEV